MSIKNNDGQIYSAALGGALLAKAIESVTGGLKIINSDHAQHHLGNGYKGYIEITNLASAGTLEYCFTTGSTVYVHAKDWAVTTVGSSLKLEIIKDPTVTENEGTEVPLSNTNDNTTNTAGSTVKASPTYTGGTTWHTVKALADSTNQVIGTGHFQTSENDEIVLKPDTEYIIKLTNTGSETITEAFITMFFYEEEGGLLA